MVLRSNFIVFVRLNDVAMCDLVHNLETFVFVN